jgi:hypothetical protein
MIVATYNVNGINGCLPALLRWRARDKPTPGQAKNG